MESEELFTACLEQATMVVKQVLPQHFANTTPDTEWNVRDLVGHMLYELSWVADIVAGKTIEEVGAAYDDLLGDEDSAEDLSTLWETAASRAEQAIAGADPDETAHLSYGEVTIEEYLREAAGDQLIHAWDLGKAIGVKVEFDPAVAQEVYDNTKPKETSLRSSSLFGPEIKVAKDASIQARLLGLFGRDSNWRPVA